MRANCFSSARSAVAVTSREPSILEEVHLSGCRHCGRLHHGNRLIRGRGNDLRDVHSVLFERSNPL